jgi:streptogramin lyase
MKYIHVYVLLLVLVSYTSCGGQNKTGPPKENIKPETIDTVTSDWPNNDTPYKIKKDRNGTILITSNTGVFRFDGESFTNLTTKVGSHKFDDVLEDRQGNLWFASLDSGVYYYNGKSLPTGQAGFQQFTTRDGLANNQVICIYEDKAGIIWFGTGGRLSRYDGKSFQNFKMKGEEWWSNFITTMMEDKTGKLWIATRGDVSIYDGKTFTTLSKDHKAFDVWSIIEDKNCNIWLGGWDGLRRYDGKTFTRFAHNTGYNFIIEDKKGNIWTSGIVHGSTWALSRYDQKSLNDKNPTVTQIMSGRQRTSSGIMEANDGSIWFGSFNGVYRYDGKTITHFKSKEGQK